MDLKTINPKSGIGWARSGFLTGILTSVAANIARTFIPPENAPPGWHPQVGAIAAAAFWPVALLISVEIISPVQWPEGRGWWLIRYGGLTTVAAIAAIISYRHMSGLLAAYGESHLSAGIGPLAVDGLMVVSSGAMLAIADNVRRATHAAERAAQAADAPVPVPSEVPAMAAQEPSEPLAGGGTALVPGYDFTALLEALSELESNGGVSGRKLSDAMNRRGYRPDERVGRGILAWLRPGVAITSDGEPPAEAPAPAVSKAGTNGDGPAPAASGTEAEPDGDRPEPEPPAAEPPAVGMEPEPAPA